MYHTDEDVNNRRYRVQERKCNMETPDYLLDFSVNIKLLYK